MARHDWYNRFHYFPKSVPRATTGGIKARSKQGGFGKSWWARRWIGVLESFNLGGRLARGRSYARRGQVTSIDIKAGLVQAEVQGSRRAPYKVTIKIKTLSQADARLLAAALSRQALFAAKLLANEMPQDIETVFEETKLSLFPAKLNDLITDCSCPDWSNPCKHVAAVYYLLGEEFDRDPFLIFKLRGLDRENLAGMIVRPPETAVEKSETAVAGQSAARATGRKRRTQIPDAAAGSSRAESAAGSQVSADPVSAEFDAFWQGGELSGDLTGQIQTPPVTAPLLKRLGGFPFWRSERRFLEVFEPFYKRGSQQALKVFVDEPLVNQTRRGGNQ